MEQFETGLSLVGKHSIVTGGASGIGKAIGQLFCAAGASVTLLDLNEATTKAAADELPRPGQAVACDVTDEASVSSAFASVGPVDILVNCAGIADVGTVLNTNPEDFDRLFKVNVRGTYLCMKAALTGMAERRSGVILNLASIAATSGLPDRFAYSMTKGAVLAMTLSVAKDFINLGIRANALSPARVHTPFVDGFVAKNYAGQETEMFAKLASSQPIGRMAQPIEVARVALFLCSDAAAFITGVDYPVDGGFFNLR